MSRRQNSLANVENPLAGLTGTIIEVVRQGHEWRVKCGGSYWYARAIGPCSLFPGDTVTVMTQQVGNKLLVKPL